MFENFSRTGYIIIIVLLLGVAFLSQQTYGREYWAKISYFTISGMSGAYDQASGLVRRGFNIGGGDKSGGGTVQASTNENKNAGKNNFLQNIFKK